MTLSQTQAIERWAARSEAAHGAMSYREKQEWLLSEFLLNGYLKHKVRHALNEVERNSTYGRRDLMRESMENVIKVVEEWEAALHNIVFNNKFE